jgi:hypothetical protein
VIRYLLRCAAIEVSWAWTAAGYFIRPYDTLADRRRWRWQPAARCGGVLVLPEEPRA